MPSAKPHHIVSIDHSRYYWWESAIDARPWSFFRNDYVSVDVHAVRAFQIKFPVVEIQTSPLDRLRAGGDVIVCECMSWLAKQRGAATIIYVDILVRF